MEEGKVLCGSYKGVICYSSRTENAIKLLLPPAFHIINLPFNAGILCSSAVLWCQAEQHKAVAAPLRELQDLLFSFFPSETASASMSFVRT